MATIIDVVPPMTYNTKLHKISLNNVNDPTMLRSFVFDLQYATIVLLETSFDVNKMCIFLSNPFEDH